MGDPLTEIERATRISIEDAMLMRNSSEEKRFSWNLIKTFITAALSGHSLGYSAICWAYTMGIRKLTRFSLCITEFQSLSSIEKKTLLLHNLDPMFNIKSAFFFQTDTLNGLLDQVERFSIFDVSKITE